MNSNSNSNTSPTPTPHAGLPEFPWPPRSSTFMKVSSDYLVKPQGQTSLKDVGDRLDSAFKSAGYGQTSYYGVPGGFALTSRLEQFKPNGLPASDPYRWSQQIEAPRIFSVDYLRSLIQGKVGRYRVIVFAVSNDWFAQVSGKRVDIDQASRIGVEGANMLPTELGNLPYTPDHTCTALIYEFEKLSFDKPGEFKDNSSLEPQTHLQQILPHLRR